ncbi:MAG: flagellar export chaperone FliS [Pirellulales bacterium]|nr:flagellar export chaperone FliS [Pirellulales bacterium]
MSVSSPGSYIETEVMTASPQKLQLMLIDAALRFAKRAKTHWKADEEEEACEVLIKAQRVMGELLGGLNREASPQLVGKIASVYVFVFRSLMESSLEHDVEKLDGAIKVLEVEQETWRQVCKKLAEEGPGENDAATPVTPLGGISSPIMPTQKVSFDTSVGGGYSFEA